MSSDVGRDAGRGLPFTAAEYHWSRAHLPVKTWTYKTGKYICIQTVIINTALFIGCFFFFFYFTLVFIIIPPY